MNASSFEHFNNDQISWSNSNNDAAKNKKLYKYASLTNELLRRLTCNWPKFNPVSIDYVIVRMNNEVRWLECWLHLLDTLNDEHTHNSQSKILIEFGALVFDNKKSKLKFDIIKTKHNPFEEKKNTFLLVLNHHGKRGHQKSEKIKS